MTNATQASNSMNPADLDIAARRYYNGLSFVLNDMALGTTHEQSGARVCALTTDFFKGMHRALTEETGEAWFLVLYRCGLIWGERVAVRLEREYADHYGKPVGQMEMSLLAGLLEEYFPARGWGRMRFDFSQIGRGLLQAELENPIYATVVERSETPVEALISGLLGALFSHFANAELLCHQTECVSLGDPVSRFIISDAQRLDPVPAWIEEKTSHDDIVKKLMAN
jgi:predicted hydrocarbon binding protein